MNRTEWEEVFYDAEMTQNKGRIRELFDAVSKRDTTLYKMKDRLARAGPVIYALIQCETATRVDSEVKIIGKDIRSLIKDYTEAEKLLCELVEDYEERRIGSKGPEWHWS